MRGFLFLLLMSFGSYAQQDSLTVLTWNVFLRPAVLSDGQMERVDSIAAYLDSSNVDVLVLQEVFHRKARKSLIKSLESTYPFASERGPRSIWGVPSGVLILSKFPMESTNYASFKKAKGSDAMAKKGVLKSIIRVNDRDVEVFGTHLQAGGGEKRKKIRQSQLNAIQSFVENSSDSSVQIIAGDFNINERSTAYDSICKKLNVKHSRLVGEHLFTANFSDQELMEASGNPVWIDFIFLRKSQSCSLSEQHILEPRIHKGNELIRLSDHNAVVVTVYLN